MKLLQQKTYHVVVDYKGREVCKAPLETCMINAARWSKRDGALFTVKTVEVVACFTNGVNDTAERVI